MKMTIDEIKEEVLGCAFNSCLNDMDYLYNTLQWAYRDYTAEDWISEFETMGLSDDKTVEVVENFD